MLNYTTTIAVEKTVGEVTRMLAKAGAASVSTHYDSDSTAVGIGFIVNTPHGPREFRLPVNVPGVHLALVEMTKKGTSRMSRAVMHSTLHAERVAWRVAKDWLEAQLAIIEAGMAALDQVMLPYLVTDPDGRTLYDRYRASEKAAITGGQGR
ncbi:MAG TPA: hypothetical protein VL043_11850 [Protaetiibacter sp.]|nr:hypothetical protein [Protaetiibacter sp.]